MVSVNTNLASINARNSLMGNSAMSETAIQRLSSGKRINNAGDDAAGLQIANSMTSQINGLKMAARNAGDGISLVNTVDGALDESTQILQRMRELAVQSASDTNSGQDRVFIQDEINALNTELNRIAATTEFNGMKLLDGTFTNMELQVGQDVGQKIHFGVGNADNKTLGAYEMKSAVESSLMDVTTTMGAKSTHASAKSALNALFTTDADYTVAGFFGTKTANVSAGADARDLAAAFNLISGDTGVSASAITRTRITHIGAPDTYSFTLEGKSSTSSTVTFTIADTDDITAAKDAINAVSGSTGIIAKMASGDLSTIDLVQEEGYDIIIGDQTAQGSTTAHTFDTSTPPASSAGATLTAATAHGFKVGDIVAYTKGGTVVTGLADGAMYEVSAVNTAGTTMSLTGTDGAAVTYGGGGGNAGDTFTRMHTIQVGTLDADVTTGALSVNNEVTLGANAVAASGDSAGFVGQVVLSSDKNFTVKSGAATNHFNTAATTVETTTLNTVGDINLKNVEQATKAIAIIDKAIMMVDAERSKAGALNNRLESTVDNLNQITVKTEASLARIMDADFASETAELSKSQVLTQAATAMLAQANQQPENILRLLQ
tara:strand:+ start:1816 stop:3633 length:1818 start_codon:yes stop_codon:yes gene_type:complete